MQKNITILSIFLVVAVGSLGYKLVFDFYVSKSMSKSITWTSHTYTAITHIYDLRVDFLKYASSHIDEKRKSELIKKLNALKELVSDNSKQVERLESILTAVDSVKIDYESIDKILIKMLVLEQDLLEHRVRELIELNQM